MRPTATIPISIQRMVCTGCGAEANASCNCGVPYEVKAARKEANRQAAKRHREKTQQNQGSRHNDVTVENIKKNGATGQMPLDDPIEELTNDTPGEINSVTFDKLFSDFAKAAVEFSREERIKTIRKLIHAVGLTSKDFGTLFPISDFTRR